MGSRFLYLTVGICAFGAFVGAISGNLWFMIAEFVLAAFNWHLAENARHTEELLLLAAYDASKNKEATDETTKEDQE